MRKGESRQEVKTIKIMMRRDEMRSKSQQLINYRKVVALNILNLSTLCARGLALSVS